MDCATYEELLFERLEGQLDADRRRRMEAHAGTCARCRALDALLRAEPAAVTPDRGDDLVQSVLRRTTGGSCDTARELLAAGGLEDELSAEPLREHLRHCGDCAAVAVALRALDRQLPLIAELRPAAGFVDDVVKRTSGRRRAPLWRRLAQRPRLALEGAYVGTLVVMLLFAFPASPLAQVPGEILGELQQERVRVQSALIAGVQRISETGRQTLAASADRMSASYAATCTPVSEDSSRLASAARCAASAGASLVVGIWESRIQPLIEQARELWSNLLRWFRGTEPTTGNQRERGSSHA